jgi:outer membrane lipase/esterase
MTFINGARTTAVLCLGFALVAGSANAMLISQLVIFGDSLADTGNNAALVDLGLFGVPPGSRTATPIPDSSFIPDLPYATNRYSNGPVWTDQFAAALGLSAANSLAGGTNFAFGGALTGPGGQVPSLLNQVGQFLGATGGIAPSSALYVVQGGGNDARQVFETAALGGNPGPLITNYANNVTSILATLETAGARNILLFDVPDIGKVPAITALGIPASLLASGLAAQMNLDLLAMLPPPSPGVDIRFVDLYGLLDSLTQNPGASGFTDVTTACAADLACISDPTTTFFWDGLHPTTAGASLIADAALAAIPEPSSIALLVAAALALLAAGRRKAHS